MLRITIRTLAIFAALTFSLSAFAGAGSSAGGADLPDYSRSAAWFLGSRPLHYCIQVGSDFGQNESDLKREVEKAFQSWRTYVEIKKVNKGRPPEDALVMNLTYQQKCDLSTDLHFFFGVDTPEVLKARGDFERPLAFSFHEDYDFDQGWVKGSAFVWLANSDSVYPDQSFPDWHKPGLISAILLHEVGHIFGNEHVLGTIMDPNIGEMVQQAFARGSSGNYVPGKNGSPDQHITGDQPWMHRIDNKVELYACEECLKQGPIAGTSHDAQQLFEKFMGRPSIGQPQIATSLHDGGLKVSFCDDKGCIPSAIRYVSGQSGAWSVIEITQNAFVVSRSKGGGMGRHLEAGTAFFQVQDHQGTWIPMTLDFNMQTTSSTSPFQLKYWKHGQRVDLMNWIPLN